ncbi:MAG TPA: hypothetical protein VIE91_04230 [Methylophilaceae bacterium]|jgi:hypothetical protein
MKKQIINVSPIQTAKVIALLYFLISLPFVGLMAISFSFAPGPKMPIGLLFLFPFLYLIFGFIFTALGAWLYNLAAGWVGGIEYTTNENT